MDLKARPVEKRTERDDQNRMFEFGKAMYRKWQKGRATYGTEVKIDPFAEAMDECLDLANYALEIYFRVRALREKLDQAVDIEGEDVLPKGEV